MPIKDNFFGYWIPGGATHEWPDETTQEPQENKAFGPKDRPVTEKDKEAQPAFSMPESPNNKAYREKHGSETNEITLLVKDGTVEISQGDNTIAKCGVNSGPDFTMPALKALLEHLGVKHKVVYVIPKRRTTP